VVPLSAVSRPGGLCGWAVGTPPAVWSVGRSPVPGSSPDSGIGLRAIAGLADCCRGGALGAGRPGTCRTAGEDLGWRGPAGVDRAAGAFSGGAIRRFRWSGTQGLTLGRRCGARALLPEGREGGPRSAPPPARGRRRGSSPYSHYRGAVGGAPSSLRGRGRRRWRVTIRGCSVTGLQLPSVVEDRCRRRPASLRNCPGGADASQLASRRVSARL
jgi:hypothetical protein